MAERCVSDELGATELIALVRVADSAALPDCPTSCAASTAKSVSVGIRAQWLAQSSIATKYTQPRGHWHAGDVRCPNLVGLLDD